MRSARRLSAALTAGLLAVTLASCASQRDDGGTGAAGGESGGTMVFGVPGEPAHFGGPAVALLATAPRPSGSRS